MSACLNFLKTRSSFIHSPRSLPRSATASAVKTTEATTATEATKAKADQPRRLRRPRFHSCPPCRPAYAGSCLSSPAVSPSPPAATRRPCDMSKRLCEPSRTKAPKLFATRGKHSSYVAVANVRLSIYQETADYDAACHNMCPHLRFIGNITSRWGWGSWSAQGYGSTSTACAVVSKEYFVLRVSKLSTMRSWNPFEQSK